MPLLNKKTKELFKILYAKNIDIRKVEDLIARGANVNVRDRDERTPLHEAVIQGNQEVIELLIAGGADINAKNKWKETPLHIAVNRSNQKVVDLLIAGGADVNTRDEDERTPIYKAILRCNARIVRSLIAAGADVNVQDNGRKIHHDYAAKTVKETLQKKKVWVITAASIVISYLLYEKGILGKIFNKLLGNEALNKVSGEITKEATAFYTKCS